ncbi:glutamate ionotropic receptor NMDA type subunit 2 isoform X2 [Cotesia typhae]|uniref:glutamate ionotropic receptor NMDA type subunit 2 isoform X2 n=1 Tax=Cotesia typhae TaxID=2053667 RepID=UPI003D692944
MKLLLLLISLLLTVFSHIEEIVGFYNKNDVIRSESGIKVGIHERGITLKNAGISSSREGPGRSSGVRLGETRSNVTRYKTAAIIPTPSTTIPPSHYTHPPQISMLNNSNHNVTYLKVGMVVPYKSFGVREYTKAVTSAISTLQRSTRGPRLEMFQRYDIHVLITMKELTPSPTAILNSLCKEFLEVNVSAILYLMNYEKYGRSTASAQYFLQLAGYLGIPVIAWNADNSGLERRASQSSLQLQLAPSLEHQTAAMLSILERYKWHQFSVVTSQIAGHDDFIQAVRERISEMQETFKLTILNAVLVTEALDLLELVKSESRVMLLYATREEAIHILTAAKELKITGENYVWIVTQSVIGNLQTPNQFPVGMLGVHFDTSSTSLVNEISTAIKVYAYGVEDFVNDPRNLNYSLNTALSCEGLGESRWNTGDRFFRYLRNVSVEGDQAKPNVEFTQDGVLRATELKIMNLRPGLSKQLIWEEIGVWKSWQKDGLDIKDIVWPGNSHTPPHGVPEKFYLRITFLEESPYINLAPPDPISGKCLMDRGVYCRVAKKSDIKEIDIQSAYRNESLYQCCSGFCIDLLQKFADEIGFTYELVRVEDGKWGTLHNGKWNGLIADVVNRKTDMILTSLTINADREAVVDFTEPFMETGIAIVVSKRTGIISPTAFLEPFDAASWMLVGIVSIHAATFMIFLFERLSPTEFDPKKVILPKPGFSITRSYWLVWAVLFQASVQVDSPQGNTARFMTHMWAMFAVVFLAIYTANLAAFMITREEFHEFTGIDDPRLVKPWSHKPMFKFGSIPWSHTESTIAKYFKEMHSYIKNFSKSSVQKGIEAVIHGKLDAFFYDGTVLDYLVAQDEDCRLLTVGSWYAMTGYGLAFARNSKYVDMFNKRILEYQENGDLERLRRYWMTGTCKPEKEVQKRSDPLALEQFLSVFYLLIVGIVFSGMLLIFEILYIEYCKHDQPSHEKRGCHALLNLSLSKSLDFQGAVLDTKSNLTCQCQSSTHDLWRVQYELNLAKTRIKQLERRLEAYGIESNQNKCLETLSFFKTSNIVRNIIASTQYADKYLTNEVYKVLDESFRTEIAEIETVL